MMTRPLTEAKMINAEHIIREVKKREILWNPATKGFLNRDLKRDTWEEVARVFNHNFEDFTPTEKDDTVDAIMRKWRNVRDYYIKEQKRNARATKTGVKKKKKKYNNYDLMTFLDPVLKRKRRAERRAYKDEDSSDEYEMVEEYLELPHSDDMSYEQYNSTNFNDSLSLSNSTTNHSRNLIEIKSEPAVSKSMTSFETQTEAPADVTQEEDKMIANKNFLLSLLPDISSLNERQNMRFRLGVLNLLNDIKFEDD